MNGARGIGFLAMDGETTCGIAGSFLDLNDPTQAHLISSFYERLGFTRTGRTDPYPHNSAVLEYEMSRPIP
jgi:hypothetical protein